MKYGREMAAMAAALRGAQAAKARMERNRKPPVLCELCRQPLHTEPSQGEGDERAHGLGNVHAACHARDVEARERQERIRREGLTEQDIGRRWDRFSE